MATLSFYQPPNAAIGGRFVSDGAAWTIALAFTDEAGRTDVTSSVTGHFTDFALLLEQAGAQLGQQICDARTLRVTLGSDIPEQKHCGTTGLGSCDCCPDNGCPKGSYWEGLGFAGEMRGGVGTRFELSGDMDYAVIRCGAWSSVGCGSGLCCARDSVQQPAGTRFEASFVFPRETTRVACFCDAGAYGGEERAAIRDQIAFYHGGYITSLGTVTNATIEVTPPTDAVGPRAPRLQVEVAPNPFNPTTVISVEAPAAGYQRLAVHDLRGRLVDVLQTVEFAAGPRSVLWSGVDAAGRRLASGAYLVTLVTPHGSQTRRVVLVK